MDAGGGIGIGVALSMSSGLELEEVPSSFEAGCGGGGGDGCAGREVTAAPVRFSRKGGIIVGEWWAVDKIRRRRGFGIGDGCCASSVSVSAEGGEAMVVVDTA